MKLCDVGKKVKEYRKDKNLTQEKLAKLSGISRVTLGKLERGEFGNVSIRTLDILLSHLGKELDIISKEGFGLKVLGE